MEIYTQCQSCLTLTLNSLIVIIFRLFVFCLHCSLSLKQLFNVFAYPTFYTNLWSLSANIYSKTALLPIMMTESPLDILKDNTLKLSSWSILISYLLPWVWNINFAVNFTPYQLTISCFLDIRTSINSLLKIKSYITNCDTTTLISFAKITDKYLSNILQLIAIIWCKSNIIDIF